MMRWRSAYIAGTGIALGAQVVSIPAAVAAGDYAADEAARTGMVEYRKADSATSPLDLAAAAGRDAIEAAPPAYLGTLRELYHTWVSHPGGPPAYNPTSELHHRLGLSPEATPLGLSNGCAMALVAIGLACRALNSDDDPASALVVASELWPPQQAVMRDAAPGLILADGAGAVLVSNQLGFASILATAHRTDSRLSGLTLGAESSRLDLDAKIKLGERSAHFRTVNPDGARYRELRDALIRHVVAEVLRDSGLTVDQIDAFVVTHSGVTDHDRGYFRLIPRIRQVVNTQTLGLHTGHVGTADWLIGLHALRVSGELKRGNLVLMLGGAGGWTEAAVLLRIV